MRQLNPHQVTALAYALRQRHPALFMEMRLRKTKVVINRIQLHKGFQRILVMAPSSAIAGWIEELQLESEEPPTLLRGSRGKRLDLLLQKETRQRAWYIINREGWRALPEIANVDWTVVILDESTFIKNPKAKVTQFCLKNFRTARQRWILAGRPNPESDEEFWSQLAFLDGEFMGFSDFWRWRIHYFHPHPMGFGWVPNKKAKDQIHIRVGERCLVMRRKDVGMDKVKIHESRVIEFNAGMQKAYNQVEKEFLLEYRGKTISTIWQTAKYMWLRQMCGGIIPGSQEVWLGKVRELTELLNGELQGEQVVVWFNFNREIALVQGYLREHTKLKIGEVEIMLGKTPLKVREQVRENFQRGSCRVLLLQQAVAQMGMDLRASDTAIYYSEPTGMLAYEQTQDRILDLDKNVPLLYLHLLVKDSVDEDLHSALCTKGLTSDLSLSKALQATLKQRNPE